MNKFEVIKANKNKIKGIYYLPKKKKENYPTVIFCHGFGSCYKFLKHHGKTLADNGIATIFFDFCGGSLLGRSDGKMTEMTVMTEVDDLKDVIDYVLTLPFVDKNNFFLCGESQGGFVSALVAAQLPNLFKGLVLWYPAFVIPDDSVKRIENGDDTVFGMKISPDYDKVAASIDVYNTIGNYNGPVKIIHGDNDNVVPISYSYRAEETYENASLTVIEGAAHGFSGCDSIRACGLMAHFILENSSI